MSTTPAPTHAPAGLATGQVGFNVTDLDRSIDFYVAVLGLTVRGLFDEQRHSHAFLGDGTGTLLTLWQQSSDRFADDRTGLHHSAFQVDTIGDVEAVDQRVRALVYDSIVPHREGSADGGLYFRDPDGTRLEVYALTGADGHGRAPAGDSPSCGFSSELPRRRAVALPHQVHARRSGGISPRRAPRHRRRSPRPGARR